MQNGAERSPRRDRVEQAAQLVAVGDVAGCDPDRLGAELFQRRRQLGGSGRLLSAAAGEEQVADAVSGNQVAGDRGAEAAGATGDQNGGIGIKRLVDRRRVRGGEAGEPWHQRHPLTQGQLRLLSPGRKGGLEAPLRGLAAVDVEQREAARVLRLGRAQQAPERRPDRVRVLALGGADRPGSEEGEARVRPARAGKPLLRPSQSPLDRLDKIPCANRAKVGDDDLGRGAGRELGPAPGQRVERLPRRPQLRLVDGPQGHRLDRDHRGAVLVVGDEAIAALAGDGSHPQRRGAGGVQADALPGKRQQRARRRPRGRDRPRRGKRSRAAPGAGRSDPLRRARPPPATLRP